MPGTPNSAWFNTLGAERLRWLVVCPPRIFSLRRYDIYDTTRSLRAECKQVSWFGRKKFAFHSKAPELPLNLRVERRSMWSMRATYTVFNDANHPAHNWRQTTFGVFGTEKWQAEAPDGSVLATLDPETDNARLFGGLFMGRLRVLRDRTHTPIAAFRFRTGLLTQRTEVLDLRHGNQHPIPQLHDQLMLVAACLVSEHRLEQQEAAAAAS